MTITTFLMFARFNVSCSLCVVSECVYSARMLLLRHATCNQQLTEQIVTCLQLTKIFTLCVVWCATSCGATGLGQPPTQDPSQRQDAHQLGVVQAVNLGLHRSDFAHTLHQFVMLNRPHRSVASVWQQSGINACFARWQIQDHDMQEMGFRGGWTQNTFSLNDLNLMICNCLSPTAYAQQRI